MTQFWQQPILCFIQIQQISMATTSVTKISGYIKLTRFLLTVIAGEHMVISTECTSPQS